jgi:hypothetical protein
MLLLTVGAAPADRYQYRDPAPGRLEFSNQPPSDAVVETPHLASTPPEQACCGSFFYPHGHPCR